jgi:pimeloyl-ACP methyl ester carboxylesterase
MDDLDEVRQFLGYAKINLYGVSYGTRAAMVYARRHPERTRAVILDSVAPTNFRLPLYIARDSQRALDLLIQDCANDRQCNARFPKLRQRIEQLLARLSANPQRVRNRDPRTGLVKEVEVNRLTIAVALFESLESSTHSALVPLLVEQAENGDFSGFLALSETFRQASSGVAQGLYYSVVCSEDAPQIEPGAIERESAGTFLSAEFAEQRLKPCGFWPRAKLDPEYFLNSSMDVPALILSGEIDPLTPPTWGAEVAARWKNSRHVVVPGSGHRAIASGGVIKLIAQFLESGNASALDLSVLQRLHRPPFFLGPSGPCLSAEVAR